MDRLKKFTDEVRDSYNCVKNKLMYKEKNDIKNENEVILFLIDSIIERMESVLLLYKNNKVATAEVVTRTAVELYLYLKYILEDNTTKRCLAFYYKTKFTEQNRCLKKIANHSEILTNRQNEKINEIKKDAEVSQKEEEFKNLFTWNISPKKNKWYNFDGKHDDMYLLSKHLGEEEMYDLMYSTFSIAVHNGYGLKDFNTEPRDNYIDFMDKDKELCILGMCMVAIKTNVLIKNYYKI